MKFKIIYSTLRTIRTQLQICMNIYVLGNWSIIVEGKETPKVKSISHEKELMFAHLIVISRIDRSSTLLHYEWCNTIIYAWWRVFVSRKTLTTQAHVKSRSRSAQGTNIDPTRNLKNYRCKLTSFFYVIKNVKVGVIDGFESWTILKARISKGD